MEIDQFNALVFVIALKAPEDQEIQRRILCVLEQKPKTTFAELTRRSEAETYMKLWTNIKTVAKEKKKMQGVRANKVKWNNKKSDKFSRTSTPTEEKDETSSEESENWA